MLFLDNKSNRIFDTIMAIADGQQHFIINNEPGTFMPLHVEILSNIVLPSLGECRNISIAHYGEQNGDLMRDPEMCILQTQNGCRMAYYFRNDYVGIETNALDFDSKTLDARRIHDHNEFLIMWLCNIHDQQKLNIKHFCA